MQVQRLTDYSRIIPITDLPRIYSAFFASCCSHLPAFKSWHNRLDDMCDNLDQLDPATRVAAFTFASMGARASPHSALLNLEFEPNPASHDPASSHAHAHAHPTGTSPGARREHACRTLQAEAFNLNHRLGLESDPSIANLEVLVLMAQHAAWTELIPRRSRTLVRLALGHFHDIQDDPRVDDAAKADAVKRLGLPLVAVDAMVAAYARKAPLVTRATLALAFRGVAVPDLASARPVHERVGGFTAMCFVWLIGCQREVASLAGSRADPREGVRALWRALDQLHQCVQRIQNVVVHLEHPPAGCNELDGIHDLHMRFATRVSRSHPFI